MKYEYSLPCPPPPQQPLKERRRPRRAIEVAIRRDRRVHIRDCKTGLVAATHMRRLIFG